MNPSVTKDISISLQSAPVSIHSLLIFLVFNLFLCVTAFLWTRCFFPQPARPGRTLAGSVIIFLTLYFAQVVLLFTLLGLLGALHLKFIFLGFVLMFILTLACLWKRLSFLKPVLPLRPGPVRCKASNGAGKHSLTSDVRRLTSDVHLMVLFALVLVLFFQGLVIATVLPANAWGALNYHLTFPVAWMKSGRIEVFSFPLGV